MTRTASPPAVEDVCGRVTAEREPQREHTEGGTKAVYSIGKTIFLYDAESDSVTELRSGSRSSDGFRPRLRDQRSVTFAEIHTAPDGKHFFGQDSIYEMDLEDRSIRELLRLPEHLNGYEWSPDARYLAYQIDARTEGDLTSIALCLYDSVAAATKRIRSFGISDCSHAIPGEEQTVGWSPVGEALLFVDTCQHPLSIYVLDLKGQDRVPPKEGTFARWFPDGRRVLYRELDEFQKPGRWFVVDTATGRAQRLRMAAGTYRPAIEPYFGNSIAFEDGDSNRPSTFLFDVTTGKTRLLVRGYGAPVWLGRDVIAVTAGGRCPERTECNGFWQELGRALGIDGRTGEHGRLKLRTTLPDDIFVTTIDVLLPVAG